MMVFKRVFVTKTAYEFIKTETFRAANKKETGGILMGYYSKNADVVLTHASPPGPRTEQRKNHIIFDTNYCQEFINNIYTQTNGLMTYIGDWHSHTLNHLKPSIIDIRELNRTANSKKSRLPNPIMAIIFGEHDELKWNLIGIDEQKTTYTINEIILLDYDIKH